MGKWVDTQRTGFKNGKLDQERKRMLDEIGFDFNPKGMTNEDIWNLQFKKLQDYFEKHGHCELVWAVDRFIFILNTPTSIPPLSLPVAGNMPNKYKEDPSLGSWVERQRAFFKTGKIVAERKAKLDEIGFDFNPTGMANKHIWNLQFKKLQDYYGKHGHCEFFSTVDCFTFILSTPTNTPPYSVPALQVKCHKRTRKTRHWAIGSTLSVHS
jgi:hypothetical protein